MNGFEVILPFLKPIEHLILDDSISEVMVNGTERIFVEKSGFLEQVQGVSLSERSLPRCRQEHRSALGRRHFRIEAHSGFASAGRQPRRRGHPAL